MQQPLEASHRASKERPDEHPQMGVRAQCLAWAAPTSSLWPFLLLFVAGLVRFVGLGRESIWLDEVTSLQIARLDPRSIVEWAAADVHPPLYYLTLHAWLRFGESEVALRSLSALLGTLTVLVQYVLARRLLGSRVAILAALMLALAPLHVWYSQETRMYVMLTLLSLLAAYWLLRALDSELYAASAPSGPTDLRWLGYALTGILALYTHYFAIIALFFANVFAAWRLREAGWHSARRWFLAQAAVALAFLPWLPVLYQQVTTGGGGWVARSIGRPPPLALVDTFLSFSVGLDGTLYPLLLRRIVYLICASAIFVAVFSSFRCSRHGEGRERSAIVYGLLYGVVPMACVWLVSQLKPMYTVRYLLVFLPGYCLLVAAGLNRLPLGSARWVVVGLLAAGLCFGNVAAWQTLQNPDWRSLAAQVALAAEPGDVVLFSPRWNIKPFEYYSRGSIALNMELPIPVTQDAADRVAGDIAQRYDRVWLVWEEEHYSDPEGLASRALSRVAEVAGDWRYPGINRVTLYSIVGASGD